MIPYEKYHETKNIWINEVPAHWSINRLKNISIITNGYSFNSDLFGDDGIPVIRIGDIKPFIDLEDAKRITVSNLDIYSDFIVKKGDFLLALTGATIGKSSEYQLEDTALLNQRVAMFRPLRYINRKFLKYVIDSPKFVEFIGYECYGGAQENIGKGELGDYYIALPPNTEQDNISNYLDDQTQKIDKLISNKKEQIEKLKELRQIEISNAVTKGLNPSVEFKDSGIEWIGKIPEHWGVNRLKNVSIVISKGTTPSTLGEELIEDGTVRFIKAENIFDNCLQKNPEFFITDETNEVLFRSKLKDGDLLIVIAGATIGKVAIVNNEFLPANTNQAVSFIRLDSKRVENSYIFYWFQSSFIIQLIWLDAVVSAQPNLSMTSLSLFPIVISSKDEQVQIADYLRKRTAKIDNLIKNIENQILNLQELRKIKIYQAVTGKIKVTESESTKN